MYIYYRNKKIQKLCEEYDYSIRKLGKRNAEILEGRLFQLNSAFSIKDFEENNHSAHCHILKGDRKGYLGIYLKHPSRLIIKPYEAIDEYKDNTEIKSIIIWDIEDYHGKRKKK